jgi:hypothetical protein
MPTASLAELSVKLADNGIQADPVAVATALLGLGSVKGWSNDGRVAASEWLEDLASEVIRSARGQTSCPILDALRERLEANAIAADGRKVASALLGLAFDEDWAGHPSHMLEWFSRVAVELGQTPR